MTESPLRLGTRASKLALWQSGWVAKQLEANGHAVEIVEIRTQGDAHQKGSLAEVSEATGTLGLFTKELQRALLDRHVDFAVHSMKDLPTAAVPGLIVGAVPERERPHDVLVGPYASVDDLPQGAVVGTGSPRRKAQLLHRRPDLRIEGIRGNLDTRLAKLGNGYDAIVLAYAGLHRTGMVDALNAIPLEVMIPAPAQGALAIECRADDESTRSALETLEHPPTRAAVTAERRAMSRLEGGCLAALGGHAEVTADELRLSVTVLSEDGRERLFAEQTGAVTDAEALGERVADHLLAEGASKLLRPRP